MSMGIPICPICGSSEAGFHNPQHTGAPGPHYWGGQVDISVGQTETVGHGYKASAKIECVEHPAAAMSCIDCLTNKIKQESAESAWKVLLAREVDPEIRKEVIEAIKMDLWKDILSDIDDDDEIKGLA